MSINWTALNAFSWIAALLGVVPLVWHVRKRNMATSSLMLWLGISNLIFAIDGVVWKDSIIVHDLVWGDIASNIIVLAEFAVPAATLCVARRLENMISPHQPSPYLSDPRKVLIFETFMVFVSPFIYLGLGWIVRPSRFIIAENLGPLPHYNFNYPTMFLFFLPPLWLTLSTLTYGFAAVNWFMKRRGAFSASTSSSRSRSVLTASEFNRLIVSSLVIGILGLIVNVVNIVSQFEQAAPTPFDWFFTHSDFGWIDVYPTVLLSSTQQGALAVPLIVYIVAGLCVFLIFGTGREASLEYNRWWTAVDSRTGLSRVADSTRSLANSVGSSLKRRTTMIVSRGGGTQASSSTGGSSSNRNSDMKASELAMESFGNVKSAPTRNGITVTIESSSMMDSRNSRMQYDSYASPISDRSSKAESLFKGGEAM